MATDQSQARVVLVTGAAAVGGVTAATGQFHSGSSRSNEADSRR